MATPDVASALPAALAAAALPDLGSASGRRGEGPGGGGTGRGPGGGEDGGVADRFGKAAWIRQPTLAEMKPFWPERAVHDKVSGTALLACELRKPGHPRHCAALAEVPAGMGFGRAAVAMSAMFLVRPVTRNDVAVNLPVLIPVTFTFEPSKPTPAAAGGRPQPPDGKGSEPAKTP